MNRREFVAAVVNGVMISAIPVKSLAANITRRLLHRPALQDLVDETAKRLGVVGGQLAIYDGEQIHEFATGFANLSLNLPVSENTAFQIGSTTKLFNASMLMTMVDDGILDLESPVKTWIKDFRLPDADAAREINIRQLISMSAGIDNGSYDDFGRGDDALDRYVSRLSELPLIFKPGTAFGYSNACTNISGLTATRATGKSWETLLAERLLAPLSLKHSVNFAEDLLYQSVALGYRINPESEKASVVPTWALPRSMAPAGGTLCCSAGDLVRLARMFLSGGKANDGTQVMSARAVDTMQTPEVALPTEFFAENWCLGPFQRNWGGQMVYGHSGTNSGGSSSLLWCPKLNVAVATNCNVSSQGYPFADHLLDVVVPEIFGIDKPAAPHPDTVKRVDVDLRPYTGEFEALHRLVRFSIDDSRLVAHASYSSGDGQVRELQSVMIPLGNDRFLPAELAISGNRNWDVAFFGDNGSGRPTHFLNGVFAMRRIR